MAAKGKAFIFLIGTALVLGGAAIFLLYILISGKDAEIDKLKKEAAEGPKSTGATREVLVANADINPGTKVAWKKVAYPQDNIPAGALSDPTYLTGRVAAVHIFEGDILVAGKVEYPTRLRQASHQVPVGKRLITLNTSTITGTGMMIKNGDMIDIVVLINVEDPDSGQTLKMSMYALQKLRVFEVQNGEPVRMFTPRAEEEDKKKKKKKKKGDEDEEEKEQDPSKAKEGVANAPEVPRSHRLGRGGNITFEVTPAQAARLHLLDGISGGSAIRYLIRNTEDTEEVEVPVFSNVVIPDGSIEPLIGTIPMEMPEPPPPPEVIIEEQQPVETGPSTPEIDTTRF